MSYSKVSQKARAWRRLSGGLLAIAALALVAAPLTSDVARAQDGYPSKPVQIIVPFPPGGGADLLVRMLAEQLQKEFNQSFVVENRSGAGGGVGTSVAAEAAPDGYTLLMANVAPMAINGSLYKNLSYNTLEDFQPISLMANFPNCLAVQPSLGAKTLAELIDLAKKEPGVLTFASAGKGSTTQLSVELLKAKTGIDMLHVPYKGAGPAITALLGGEVSMYFGSLPGLLPHLKGGELIPLGLSSLTRSSAAPEIPTVAEQGFPGFEAVTWIGIVAPTGVPEEAVQKLNKAIVKIMNRPDIVERLHEVGAEPMTSTPEEFRAYIESETKKWGDLIHAIGLEPN